MPKPDFCPNGLSPEEMPIEATTNHMSQSEKARAEAQRINTEARERRARGESGNPIFDINPQDKSAAKQYADELNRKKREKEGGISEAARRDIEEQRLAAAARTQAAREAAAELKDKLEKQDRTIKEQAAAEAERIRKTEAKRRDQTINQRRLSETPRAIDDKKPTRGVWLHFERKKLFGPDVYEDTVNPKDEETLTTNLKKQGYTLKKREAF